MTPILGSFGPQGIRSPTRASILTGSRVADLEGGIGDRHVLGRIEGASRGGHFVIEHARRGCAPELILSA